MPLRRRCTANCAVRSLLLAGSGEELDDVLRAANSVQASVHRSGGGWKALIAGVGDARNNAAAAPFG